MSLFEDEGIVLWSLAFLTKNLSGKVQETRFFGEDGQTLDLKISFFLSFFRFQLWCFLMVVVNIGYFLAAEEDHHHSPANYHYNFKVRDEYSGLHFGRIEDTKGDKTTGEYHIESPDGSYLNVNYHFDDHVIDHEVQAPIPKLTLRGSLSFLKPMERPKMASGGACLT